MAYFTNRSTRYFDDKNNMDLSVIGDTSRAVQYPLNTWVSILRLDAATVEIDKLQYRSAIDSTGTALSNFTSSGTCTVELRAVNPNGTICFPITSTAISVSGAPISLTEFDTNRVLPVNGCIQVKINTTKLTAGELYMSFVFLTGDLGAQFTYLLQ